MMRRAGGSNDHPDPQYFAQLFRLLCCYSLIKPPKGSNVEGPDLLKTLMQTEESLAAASKSRTEWLQKIDDMLEKQVRDDETSSGPSGLDHDYVVPLSVEVTSWKDSVHDHPYDVTRTSAEVQCYIAGYVVRKMMKKLKCHECINSLKSHEISVNDSTHAFINLVERFGGLIRPSDPLLRLTECLESTVLDVVGKFGIHVDTIHTILQRASEIPTLPMVGCAHHSTDCTKKIIDFYIVMRASFLVKSYNANQNESRVKTKRLRKNAKL